MARPVVHAAAEMVYRLLPDYMREADEANDWLLLRFVAGASTGLESSVEMLTLADPDTSRTGTCELVNAAVIPREWLGWLGSLVGINVNVLPVAFARSIVAGAGESQRRGSRNAVKSAVSRTLSNQSPPPRVWANLSGADPYIITVVTNTSQTPDVVATLEAAVGEKPAGMDILLQIVDGAIVAELEYAFPMISDLVAEFATVGDIDSWIPTT